MSSGPSLERGWNPIALALLWTFLLGAGAGCGRTPEPLLIFCAAGIKEPIEATARRYEKETGNPVQLQYGPSQSILLQAEVSKKGDLFVPGDDSYVELARSKDLVKDAFPLAHMKPVLIVKKGNPKRIGSIKDLLRGEVKLGQVNPDGAAAGKLVRTSLQKSGDWDEVAKHTMVFTGTVNEVATAVRIGSLDAGFVWDVLATADSGLEIVSVAELAQERALVAVAVLKSSTQPEAGLAFASYLASPDKGGSIFASFGFAPAGGATTEYHK